jgi:hypothetical protein
MLNAPIVVGPQFSAMLEWHCNTGQIRCTGGLSRVCVVNSSGRMQGHNPPNMVGKTEMQSAVIAWNALSSS